MWCSGSTCLVRVGGDVFASGLETRKNAQPLNNCRWTLYNRTGRRLATSAGRPGRPDPRAMPAGHPCPAARYYFRRTPRSPILKPTMVRHCPRSCKFSAANPQGPLPDPFACLGGPRRSFPALLSQLRGRWFGRIAVPFSQDARLHARRMGFPRWRRPLGGQGKLVWPWGSEYEKPEPIRVCYPDVAIRGREVYFCGVSDIVQPHPKWRETKRKLTGQNGITTSAGYSTPGPTTSPGASSIRG